MFRLQRRSSSVIPSLKFIQFFAIHHYSTIAIIISKILEESRGFQLQRQSSSAINNNFKNFMRKPKIPIAKAIVKVQLFAKHQLFNNFKKLHKETKNSDCKGVIHNSFIKIQPFSIHHCVTISKIVKEDQGLRLQLLLSSSASECGVGRRQVRKGGEGKVEDPRRQRRGQLAVPISRAKDRPTPFLPINRTKLNVSTAPEVASIPSPLSLSLI